MEREEKEMSEGEVEKEEKEADELHESQTKEELDEGLGRAAEVLHRVSSNDADLKPRLKKSNREKRKKVNTMCNYPNQMEVLLSPLAEAFLKGEMQKTAQRVGSARASNAHDWTGAPQQGYRRVFYLPGSEHLAANADEALQLQGRNVILTEQMSIFNDEGAVPQQGTVAGTVVQHFVVDDEERQERKRRKVILQRMSVEAKKQAADELDERARRVALRSAGRRAPFARNELQPADMDFEEALERAKSESKEEVIARDSEDHQERERREKDRQAGASASATNRGKQDDEDAIRIAIEMSAAEARARHEKGDEERHDQDAKKEEVEEAAKRTRTGKGKLHDLDA